MDLVKNAERIFLIDSGRIFSSPSPIQVAKPKQWYAGGKLHKKKGRDWVRAARKDKMATCADFIINYDRAKGIQKKYDFRVGGSLYIRAHALVVCLDTVWEDGQPYALELEISEAAVACLILMESQN